MIPQRYVAEAIGTFCLVFAGTGAIISNEVSHGAVTHPGIALTFGLVVMAVIYAVGDVSGAHLNPAVTFGFWTAGRLPDREMFPYFAAQFTGAFAASGLWRVLFWEQTDLGSTNPSGAWWQSFVLEIVLTAILMYVILNVSTGAKEKGIMAGAAIGAVVGLEAMFAGPISGASMNPARSLAPAVMSGTLRLQWIYLVAPMLGAAVAVIAFRLSRQDAGPAD